MSSQISPPPGPDSRPQVVPQADGATRTEAEALERALEGKVGEERTRGQLVGIGGPDRGAGVAKQAVHRRIAGELAQPLLGGHLRLGQLGLALAHLPKARADLGRRLGQAAKDQTPAAPLARVDDLAINAKDRGRPGFAHVQRNTQQVEGLLEAATALDRDGPPVDDEAVDLLARCAAAQSVLGFNDQDLAAGSDQVGRRAHAAGTRADDDDVVRMGCVRGRGHGVSS